MAIIVNLDVMLAKRKMRSKELAERIGITEQNVSLLKSGKVKGVRFDTLERICEVLQCQPGDILEYRSQAMPVPHSGAEPMMRPPDRLATAGRGRVDPERKSLPVMPSKASAS